MDQDSPFNTPHDLSRRTFMKFMGAGALLQGLILPACKRTNEYIVPYNSTPEWTLPGVSTAYSTCMPHPSGAVPLLAVCREGRPIKLEPQPSQTESPGLSAAVQATILELYDPNRSSQKFFHGKPASDEEFAGAFAAWARKTASGGRVGFVFSENDSPLRKQMIEEIKRRNPNARFFSWEPLSRRNALQATALSMGEGVVQMAALNHARRILSLDCDFLALDEQGPINGFMQGRIPEGVRYQNPEGDYDNLNRLYTVEGRFSVTGGMADERLALPPSRIALFILCLAREIAGQTNAEILDGMPSFNGQLSPDEQHWLKRCADDLCANRGQSLVLLGSQYSTELHHIVLAINTALNANGITLNFLQSEAYACEPLEALPEAITSRAIDTLFIMCTGNPVVDAPASIRVRELLETPGLTSIRLSLYHDETAEACTWHLPAAHYLESWGIERDMAGRYCYRQPVIMPLYNGIAEEEILNGLLHSRGILVTSEESTDRPSPVYQRARKCFDQITTGGGKENAWADALKTGMSPQTAFARVIKAPKPPGPETWAASIKEAASNPEQGKYEIQYIADYSTYGGRYINNAWLRECPDPVTGFCWDAVAQMSETTAQSLGLDDTGILTVAGQASLLATTTPGMADGLIVLPLGYGVKSAFDTDKGLSPNTWVLKNRSNGFYETIERTQLGITPTGKHPVAALRPVVDDPPFPIISAKDTGKAGKVVIEQPATGQFNDKLHQWAMSIDLSICIGCNACLIACQAENNIPVVGPEQIAAGRIMHWIRIDRYFVKKPEGGFSFIAQPVACQQCEAAPCESVCPVNATTHTSEGLSAMVYPRCWGTRYCAANCPYKARRFNFLDYAKACDESTKLQRNPHVTVRSRGVMEKCSYCVQRIEDAKTRYKAAVSTANNDRALTDDDLRLPPNAVKTACQLACPAGAITFGNLLQKDTVVNTLQTIRNSRFLDQLGTRPRTSYLAKVQNKLDDQP